MLRKTKGFTFIELSIALFILSIMASSIMVTSEAIKNYSRKKTTEYRLSRIEKSLAAFLADNERLPCPASLSASTNALIGIEKYDSGNDVCEASATTGFINNSATNNLVYGGVPSKTLGLSDKFASDGFGNKFLFVVDEQFVSNFATTKKDSASISVNTQGDTLVTTNAIYTIISHGANGHGAFPLYASSQINTTGSTEEEENKYNEDSTTFYMDYEDGSFDDILRYKTKQQAIYKAGWEGIGCLRSESYDEYNSSVEVDQEDATIDGPDCASNYTSTNPSGNNPIKICERYGEWSDEIYPCESNGCTITIDNPTSTTKYILDGQELTEECPAGYVGLIKHTCSGTTDTEENDCVILNSGCQEFGYTNSIQAFTVPDNITSVKLQVWGAEGAGFCGASSDTVDCYGGNGGYAEGDKAVTEGQNLYVYVGGQGSGYTGGWNGGNGSTIEPRPSGGGTDIRTSTSSILTCSTSTDPRIIVAGGGGGGESADNTSLYGGSGGGTNGGTGTSVLCTGGTQTSGGTADSSRGGSAGTCGQGGASTRGSGGGGWYGGGGDYRGCGGSGYIGGVTDGTMSSGVRIGHGFARICWGDNTACDSGSSSDSHNSICIPAATEADNSAIGLTLWLDASDSSTITYDSSNLVSEWRDKSGNGNDLTQSNASYQPLYMEDAVNGKPAIKFVSDDYMAKSSVLGSDLFSADETTACIVTKNAVSTLSEATIFSWSMTDGNDKRVSFQTPYIYADYYWDAPLTSSRVSLSSYVNPATIATSWNTWCFVKKSESSASVYLNKKEIYDGTTGSSSIDVTHSGELKIGHQLNGYIMELKVYNKALSEDEIAELQEDLLNKWLSGPQQSSGLILWLDADDETTITKNSSNLVSEWADKSGQNNDATQSTDSVKPTSGVEKVNGKNVLSFDQDWLTLPTTAFDKSAGTVFLVAKAGLEDMILYASNATTTTDANYNGFEGSDILEIQFCLGDSNNEKAFMYQDGGTSSLTLDDIDESNNNIITYTYSRSANTTSAYVNGIMQASGTLSNITQDYAVTNVFLGRHSYDGDTSRYLTGNIAEVLVYDRVLNSKERQAIESYLSSKWNSEAGGVSGLKLWLDASDETTITKNSSNLVSTWADKSGNAASVDVLQSTDSAKPTFTADLVNGNSALKFDGGDFLASESVLGSDLFGITEATICIAQKLLSITAAYNFSWAVDQGTRVGFHAPWSDGTLYWDAPMSGSRLSLSGYGSDISLSPWNVWCFEKKSEALALITLNGAVQYNSSTSSALIDTTVSDAIRIGAGLNGYIGEVLVYNKALDNTERATIENYLINKWGSASVDSTGLKLWLDASDESTITKDDTGYVSAWNDKSSTGATLIQSTSTSKPKFTNNVINEKSALRFDGGDRLNKTDILGSALFGTNAVTICLAQKQLLITSGTTFSWLPDDGGDSEKVSMHVVYTNGILYWDAPQSYSRISFSGNSDKIGNWHVWCFEKTSETTAKIYIDGIEFYNGSTGSNDIVQTNGDLQVGSNFNGYIGEIMIYNKALSDSERIDVQDYLMDKWGIDPSQVSEMILWLDASDTSTIVQNNNYVSQWLDKSGNGNNVLQSTSTAQPLYTNTKNNLNVVTFDGTSDYMQPDITDNIINIGNDAKTIFLVAELGGDTSSIPSAIAWNTPGGSENAFLLSYSSDGYGLLYNTSGASNLIAQDMRNSFFLESLVDNGSLSVTGYLNGDEKETLSYTTNEPTRFTIGAELDGTTPGDWYPSNIAEIIIYNKALTSIERQVVENYLLDKWIPKPDTISNLVLWLDASDEATVTLNGNYVSKWEDKSTSGNDAVQTTSSYQPLYTSTQNSKHVITFDGTDDGLELSQASTLNTSNFTVFVAFVSEDTGRAVLVGDYNKTNSYNINYELHTSLAYRIYFAANPDYNPDNLWEANIWNIYCSERNGSTWLLSDKDGTTSTTTDSSPATISYNSSQKFSIARDSRTGDGTPLDGSIAEILIYDRALTAEERNNVRIYLKRKWGI